MSGYKLMKVFDLSSAPPALREADELADLRVAPGDDCGAILHLEIGSFTSPAHGLVHVQSAREMTLVEYNLEKWLKENGAEDGEGVFVYYKNALN